MVVEYIKENFDSDLKFLDYLDLAIHPNIIHYFIAQMILKQNFVVTTNFDYLLKRHYNLFFPIIAITEFFPL